MPGTSLFCSVSNHATGTANMAAVNVEANGKEDSTRVHNNQLSNSKRKGSDNNDSKSNSEGGKGNKVGA